MAEEIVKVISVDTRKSERSIKDLKNDIKALKKELESAAIGSKEFDLKLAQLGKLQREYKAINEEVVASSKPVKQQMFELARFGENLAKSYSAINAAIGLLSDGNEDVQKALLKTSQMIQLIQGLSGFAPLIKQIPSLIDKFKSWFKVLDPIEEKVTNIASEIAGINVAKLNSVNASVQGNSEPPSASAAPGTNISVGIDSVNQGLAEQKQMIVPLNDEWNKYNQELTAAKMAARDYAPDLEKLVNIFTEYNNHTTTAKINMDELNRAITEVINGDPSKLADFLKNSTIDLDALNETAAAFGWTSDQLVQGLQNLEEGLIDDAKFVDDLTKSMEAAKGAAAGMGKATKTVGSVMKSVLSTVGWTVVVTAILAALGALWKWITGLQTAAKKQRELNKAINESAASIESKSLIAFKELARRYKEIGDTTEEKAKFLEQFKKKIEETGLAITTIKDADEAFINNTGAYIQALKDRAKAQAIENEAVRIYEEYLNKVSEIKADAEDLTFWQRAGVAWMRSEGAILPDNWEGQLMADNLRKANEEVKKETEAMEATLNKLFDEMFTMEQQSEPYFEQVVEEVKTVTETTTSAKENELEMLAKYYKDARRLFMDARTRELDEVQEKYDEQIALAIKHNQDTTLLEQAKQREIDNIIKKYNDERLAQLQADAERQYQVIQEQINRIRMMNDTSNLGEPQEQSYTTEYNQGFGKAFMAGSKFFYQSGEDVKNQYDAQVEYNNKLYELTQSRIEQENELLNKQLEIEGITADRRLEIERTLRENEMALSDAAIKNEADNIAAYKSLQEKKNQATQSTLSVASDVFGAMATLAGEETKAGKAFAVTQAIIDTYSAANSAYASMAGVPYVGPALGIAAAAAAIASGIANVKTILSTNVSSDVNSVSLSTGAVATPPALTPPPIEYTRNLLGDKETDELNKATKVYVLESDITAVQNKVKVTEDNASF